MINDYDQKVCIERIVFIKIYLLKKYKPSNIRHRLNLASKANTREANYCTTSTLRASMHMHTLGRVRTPKWLWLHSMHQIAKISKTSLASSIS